MHGVRSVAHAAKTVERWDPQTRGEIAIGAAAHRGFSKLPSQLARDGHGLRV